jgi:hypothetical protein
MNNKFNNIENQLKEVLYSYRAISLDEMNHVSLMNRIDTKFILPTDLLLDIVTELIPDYKILEIESERLFQYKTQYYDTKNFDMYDAHQNGKLNRFKVRKREYVASNKHFLEVKFKNNKRRTIKKRIERIESPEQSSFESTFVEQNSPFKMNELELKLSNHFKRITLVGKAERLTIDFNLGFIGTDGQELLYPEAAIIEFKQEKFNITSKGMQVLKKFRIRPESCSKYCIGAASLHQHIKSNRLKKKFGMISKFNK